jgi:hypothetical protein
MEDSEQTDGQDADFVHIDLTASRNSYLIERAQLPLGLRIKIWKFIANSSVPFAITTTTAMLSDCPGDEPDPDR